MNMAQLQAMKDRAVEIDADEAKKQGSARRRPAAVAADAGT